MLSSSIKPLIAAKKQNRILIPIPNGVGIFLYFTMQNKKTKGEIFLAIGLILLSILGLIAKFYTHIGEWKTGQIIKIIIIAGIGLYGVFRLISKKPKK